MDVLHITHQFAPETRGGVESYVMDVGCEQQRRGLDVQVLTGSHQGWESPGIEEVRGGPLRLHKLHRDDLYFDYHAKVWHPGAGDLIGEFLDLHQPKVVHLHQWIRMTSNLVEIVRSRGIPVIVTLHDFFTSCPRAFRMRPDGSSCHLPLSVENCVDCVPHYGHEKRVEIAEGIELFRDQCASELASADAVLVGMGTTADLLAATTSVERERFRVLTLGYQPRFTGKPRLAPPSSGKPFRFAFWGGVAEHKGIVCLVDAFRKLIDSALSTVVELHVLGGFATPAFEAELREQAAGLPLFFHGPFTIDELLAVSPHVGVFPSTCLETHGLVLDECFELGLPCIVSADGVLAERAGDAARLARPGDAGDLARAMESLCTDFGAWQSLRAQIPPPGPGLGEHCDALQRIYADAANAVREGTRREGAPISDRRRIAFLMRQRESALEAMDPGPTFR